ncbi:MAG: glycogen/starch/alpha-glucan phosphorylase [Deltaproteobacteria bacterium]|nr:glycogen/starch/alpha-glucan phosphorylase [Deltaproteobacteria bacterium]
MPPRERASLPPPAYDDRTGLDADTLRRAVLDHLHYTCARDRDSASLRDLYTALAHSMRDRLLSRWLSTRATYRRERPRRVYYLSAEYLLGRAMAQNLDSLGLYDTAERTLAELGVSLPDVLEEEPDPGLGNGGLGRLAACFLDSMAALQLPGFGYGIRYEYGIFEQRIEKGEQVERGDSWLRYGNPWEIPRYDLAVPVTFYGRVDRSGERAGKARWVEGRHVIGIPYDIPIAGYRNATVNTLRLWSARAAEEFDLHLFNSGDFRRAVEEKVTSETISRVLYPADHSPEGRELRLKQQYFFVACSIADIVRRHQVARLGASQLRAEVAIQLNDTHPSIAIAELMRVLLDDHDVPWDEAWAATERTFGYTNHTLMPEALEKWPVDMFERLLPRHLEIIYEINGRLLRKAHIRWGGDPERLRRISIIEEHPERQVRMAHLAATASCRVNGVAALHSELVRTRLLADFAELYPDKFINETNGVSPRRWLRIANPELTHVLARRLGDDFLGQMDRLEGLRSVPDPDALQAEVRDAKLARKRILADVARRVAGVTIDPRAMIVAQVKRIHEYKRQLLAALHVIELYLRLREGRVTDPVPRVFVFAGKAAPGYAAAKAHIRFLCDVAGVVNDDPAVGDRLRVVFLPNYGVTLAERIIPATDVSLQISLAGTEASGTGNMKLAMNGALTVGTLDGANIELRDAVGAENFFLFGLTAEQVEVRKAARIGPRADIERSPTLAHVLGVIRSGFFSPDDRARGEALARYLEERDPYLVCADFDDYVRVQDDVEAAFRLPEVWSERVVRNISAMAPFSSDETIRRYARDIWNAKPVPPARPVTG